MICFDEFKKGNLIRKIPICKHIFHSTCIENWFKTKMEDTTHKCPLCNCEISIEKVKQAKKDNMKKKMENRDKKLQEVIDKKKKAQISPARRSQFEIQEETPAQREIDLRIGRQ